MKNNIRVNDIPLNERPIEKLLQFGVNTLSHDELLAIVLRTGTKGENVIELSKRLLWELNGLDGLLDVSYEEVSKIKGIKKVKACQIIAIMEIVNRVRTLKSQNKEIKISSPRDVSALLINEMANLNQEVFKLILLNTKNIVISTKDIFKGTLNSSVVHPPISTIILPVGSPTGSPAPIAAAIGSSIKTTSLAPANLAASSIALLSTSVTPEG